MTPNRERHLSMPSTPARKQAHDPPPGMTPQLRETISDSFEHSDSDEDSRFPRQDARRPVASPLQASPTRGSYSQPILTSREQYTGRNLKRATTDGDLSTTNDLRRLLEEKDEHLAAKEDQIKALSREIDSLKRQLALSSGNAGSSFRPSYSTGLSLPTPSRQPTTSAAAAAAAPALHRATSTAHDSSHGFSFRGLEDTSMQPPTMWN